ncbi:MAG: HAD family hydrolase [Planctomycetota bacterium]
MAPQPTGVEPTLNLIPGIKAVLFDIYGTLLISGAGDISLQTETSSDVAFQSALSNCGLPAAVSETVEVTLLQSTIDEHKVMARQRGRESPEVNIVDVWSDVLRKISARSEFASGDRFDLNTSRLAIEYEVRTNPVWPMPGIQACLSDLRQRKLLLGVISNAQEMTPALFPAILDATLNELGFDHDLQFFSWQYEESKPGRRMFEAAIARLQDRQISPGETLFIGNDMLNDVWAAEKSGFRTVLFAGDRRSLRLRDNMPQCRDCRPDAVITDLTQLSRCLAPAAG